MIHLWKACGSGNLYIYLSEHWKGLISFLWLKEKKRKRKTFMKEVTFLLAASLNFLIAELIPAGSSHPPAGNEQHHSFLPLTVLSLHAGWNGLLWRVMSSNQQRSHHCPPPLWLMRPLSCLKTVKINARVTPQKHRLQKQTLHHKNHEKQPDEER